MRPGLTAVERSACAVRRSVARAVPPRRPERGARSGALAAVGAFAVSNGAQPPGIIPGPQEAARPEIVASHDETLQVPESPFEVRPVLWLAFFSRTTDMAPVLHAGPASRVKTTSAP